MTTGGTSYGYSYDGDGRRSSSDTRSGCGGTPQASSISRYAWDELSAYGDVVAELNSTNTTATMQYVVGDGTVLAQQAGTSAPARFLLHDGQGSTRSLFDNGGTLLENYVYDAFGTLKAPTTGTPQTRYLYTGQQFDAATKLYSLRARYYNPAQGRFTARDTADINLQNPIELNRYGYTANNPINAADPSGYGIIENFSSWVQKNATVIQAHIAGAAVQGELAGITLVLKARYLYYALLNSKVWAGAFGIANAIVENPVTGQTESVVVFNANNITNRALAALEKKGLITGNTTSDGDIILNRLPDFQQYIVNDKIHAEQILVQWAIQNGRVIKAVGISNKTGPCGPNNENCQILFQFPNGLNYVISWSTSITLKDRTVP